MRGCGQSGWRHSLGNSLSTGIEYNTFITTRNIYNEALVCLCLRGNVIIGDGASLPFLMFDHSLSFHKFVLMFIQNLRLAESVVLKSN